MNEEAKLADAVLQHMFYSSRFDGMTCGEIRSKYLIPIFGKDVIDEIMDYHLKVAKKY